MAPKIKSTLENNKAFAGLGAIVVGSLATTAVATSPLDANTEINSSSVTLGCEGEHDDSKCSADGKCGGEKDEEKKEEEDAEK